MWTTLSEIQSVGGNVEPMAEVEFGYFLASVMRNAGTRYAIFLSVSARNLEDRHDHGSRSAAQLPEVRQTASLR
jgi:hypothetical protein